MQLNSMKNKIKAIEKQNRVSKYLPVLFLDDETELENYKHLIGPETVVIIDDIL
jgi:hypothetical protein